jgi:uncharacterized RDD family membrane protein YckC
MSDPTQNPKPEGSGNPPSSGGTSEQPPSGEPTGPTGPPPGQAEQPPGTWSSQPPPPGQGSYGTTPPPPPPQEGWEQPGQYPPHATTGGVGQPADLTPRFVARLLDFILLGFVQAVLVSLVVVGVVMGQNAGGVTGWGMPNGASWAANSVSSLVSAAIALAYFTLMESRRGQTVGKMIMKLETRGPDGGRPTTEQALKRNAFTAIGAIGAIPFVGFVSGLLSLAAVITIAVTISNDRVRRHGWHDDFAGGTTVFRIG